MRVPTVIKKAAEHYKEKALFPLIPGYVDKKDGKLKPLTTVSDERCYIKASNSFKTGDKLTYKKLVDGEIEEVSSYPHGFMLITGALSQIVVLDLDNNHNDGRQGTEVFKEFCENLSEETKDIIDNTYTVNTPSGGVHIYFKAISYIPKKTAFIENCDIISDKKPLSMPYSRAIRNNELKEYTPIDEKREILEIPNELVKKIMGVINYDNEVKKEQKKKDVKVTSFNSNEWGVTGRNDTLYKELINVCDRANIRDLETITKWANIINNSFKNPLGSLKDDGPKELENTIQSVYNRLSGAAYLDDKNRVNMWKLSQHVINSNSCYRKGNLFYVYNHDKKVYEYKIPQELDTLYFKYPVNDNDKTTRKAQEFSKLIMLNSKYSDGIYHEKKYINCLNGIIDVKTNKLLPHDSKYKLNVQFKGKYDVNWKDKYDKSKFKKFLTDILDDETILTLQEAWGIMLAPNMKKLQTAFFYLGEGSNGKSSVIDIQQALLGEEIEQNRLISTLGIDSFNGTHSLQTFEGKHVNIQPDNEVSNFGEVLKGNFKSISAGDTVMVNRKNKDILSMAFNVPLFFGLNTLPPTSDKSHGFYRRMGIIPFYKTFGTKEEVESGKADKLKDPFITDEIIKNELDIVLNWAYEGLQRLINNNYHITLSTSARCEKEKYKEDSDSSYLFFKEYLEKDSCGKIPTDSVYNAYCKWCLDEGITPLGKAKFTKGIKNNFNIECKPINGKRFYVGVSLQKWITNENKKA